MFCVSVVSRASIYLQHIEHNTAWSPVSTVQSAQHKQLLMFNTYNIRPTVHSTLGVWMCLLVAYWPHTGLQWERMVAQCSVCSLQDGSLMGNHYGATRPTCLSCRSEQKLQISQPFTSLSLRAFFRRTQERKTALKCKKNTSCQVDKALKQLCADCRYNKCVR